MGTQPHAIASAHPRPPERRRGTARRDWGGACQLRYEDMNISLRCRIRDTSVVVFLRALDIWKLNPEAVGCSSREGAAHPGRALWWKRGVNFF